MGPNVTEILLRAQMEVSGVETGVNQIQKSLKGLTLPKGLTDDLEKSFSKLTPLLKDYQKQLNKINNGSFSKKDLQNFEVIRGKVNEVFGELRTQIGSINGQEIKLKVDAKEITSLEKKIEGVSNNLKTQLANVFTKNVNTDSINKMMTDIANVAIKSSNVRTMSSRAKELFNTQQYAEYNAEIDKIKNKILSLNSVKPKFGQEFIKNFDEIKDKPEELKKAFDDFFNSLKVNNTKVERIENLKQQLAELGVQLDTKQLDAFNNAIAAVEQQNDKINDLGDSFDKIGDDVNQAGREVTQFQDELSQLQSSTQYFFSLRNMINLFRRGVQEAVDTVKDLDAAMAETAVVTEYSVSDMWAKLPEYTANAKKLGSTIQDMYEATTLYYQQGLNTEQAMGIAGETMKMARIGALDAKDATDKMTAALRGFHMELNEASAQRVNDVYSNLAAKTASDTAELGNAMQRTASIAANAGMSFEGTAAFLAQAIETTREPAENIGTAMKTIIARMQEMKKNPLEIGEVDGEEVDYNKIDAALKSVGISLKAANGAFRDNDEVLLEISQKWDTLTQTQQRYIATTIAGSRQQSRFIAMVGDYDRTMELMGYANDSAGASAEQFGKLEESLEFKTNKLKDTWQEFLMSIANEGAIKTFVGGADILLTGVNKIISALSQATGPAQNLTKSVLSLGTAFIGLRGFGKITNGLIRGFGSILDPTTSFGEQFKLGFSNSRNSLQAAAISNPIVTAIRQAVGDLIPHIDKEASYSSRVREPGDLKTAQNDLNKQLNIDSTRISRKGGSTAKSTYTTNGLFDIINENQLTPKQQKQFFDKNPGLKRNLKKSLGNLLEEVGADKKTKDALVKGFTSGEIPLEDVFKSPVLKKTWGEQYQEILNKYGTDAYKKGGESRAAINDLKRRAGVTTEMGGVKAFKEGGALYSTPGDEYRKGVSTWLAQQQELSKSEQILQKIANNAQKVSSGMMAAGMAFSMVGSAVGDTNEELGKVLTTMGSIVTVIGTVGMAFSTFMNMNPQLMAVSAVIGAIAGAIALVKKQSNNIKKAGEEVVKTYKEINSTTQENISTLKTYQEQSEHWSKGVDEFGNNINLSDDEYAAYQDAVNKIAELNPNIIKGYNAQGKAIVDINEALKETIRLEKQRQQNATNKYLDEGSFDKIIKARDINDSFQKATTKLKFKEGSLANWFFGEKGNFGINIGKWFDTTFDTEIFTEKTTAFADDVNTIINNLQQDLGDKNLSKVLKSFEIDAEKISQGDAYSIRQLVKNRDKIYSAALNASKNGLSQKTTEVFNNLDDSVKAAEEAIGPTLEWLQTSISQSTIFKDLPDELKSNVLAGLKDIALTPNMTFDDMQSEARQVAEGLRDLTKEGSAYSYIMEEVTQHQEDFFDTLNESEYLENIKDDLADLDTLMQHYENDTTAYGRAIYEFLVNQKAAIENFTTSGTEVLSNAINEMSGVIAEAEGAYENFQKATKTDFSTGKNSMKSIYDELFKETEGKQLHLEGTGDQTFWKGAENLLGREFVEANKYKDVVKALKDLGPYLKEGQEGFDNFWNAFMQIDPDKIDGLKIDKEKGTYEIEDSKAEEVYKAIAKEMKMSESFLLSMLNAGRQYASINFTNNDKVNKALSTDKSVLKGKDGTLFTTNDYLNSALSEGGITIPQEQQEWKDEHLGKDKVNLVAIDNLDELSDKNIESLGITDMRSAIEVLGSTGIFDSQQIEEITKKMPDYNPEDYQGAWQQFLNREADPSLAPIESIESNVASIASAVARENVAKGNITQDDLNKAAEFREKIKGGVGVDTATQYFGKGLNEYGTPLTAEQYKKGKADLEEGLSYAEQWKNAFQQAADNATDLETKEQYQKAADDYAAAEQSIKNNLEAVDRNYAKAYAEHQQDLAEEQYMAEGKSLTEAKAAAEEVYQQAFKDATAFIESGGAGTLDETTDTGWKYGNVTQANRPQGLTDESGKNVTVLGGSKAFNTGEGQEIEIAFTPVVTLDGKGDILEDETVDAYINALIQQLQSEGKEVNLNSLLELDSTGEIEGFEGIKNVIADVGENAAITAIQMHALEAGLDLTTIDAQYQKLDSTIQKVGRDAEQSGEKIEGTNKSKTTTDVQATTYEVFTAGAEGNLETVTEKLEYLKTNYPEVYTKLITEAPQYGLLEQYSKEIDGLSDKPEIKQTITTNIAGGKVSNIASDITNLTAKKPELKVGTNAEEIQKKVENLVRKANKLDTTKTLTVNVRKTGVKSITVDGHTWDINTAATGLNNKINKMSTPIFGSAAKGGRGQLGPKGKGGLTLTGELGYEVAWLPSENRSVILGANGPQMLNLPNDAVVWNHKQSKEILKRKSIPAGSMHSGSYQPSTSPGSNTQNNPSKAIVDTAKKTGDNVSKSAENTSKAVARVLVWWDNAARRATEIQRQTDKNQKQYSKYLKEMQATLKATGSIGQGDSFIANTQRVIAEQQTQYNKAIAELSNLELGAAAKTNKGRKNQYNAGADNIVQISYKKGKKTKTAYMNTADYIYQDANGAYQINQAALNSVKNADQRKALTDALNKEINDRISKRNAAEDAIEKAQEALEKFAEELYKTFFAWEVELTKIWNLTKKIEATENNISRIKTYEETLNKQISTGLGKSSDSGRVAQTMQLFRQGLEESTNKLKTQVGLIDEQKTALQKAISIEDERTTLASIQAKLNQRQLLDNEVARQGAVLSTAQTNLASVQQQAATKQAQIADLKAKKKKESNSNKKKKIQAKIDAAQAELNTINSYINYYAAQVNQATAAYNQAVANATTNLSNTEKLAYEQYAKSLQDQIQAQTTAQKYLTVRNLADGTVEVKFATEEFERDKLQGLFTEEQGKAIQDYVKNIEETSSNLSEAYKNANTTVNELYDQLEQLENEWVGYANELWDIHDKEAKAEVDNFKKLSDSISKALKDLLDEVKRKIDERRQQEENAKTEKDISQKQQRLAALRANTAGGNQVAIAQLEKEIAEAQQNYQQSLEDQLLNKLQEQTDIAEQQRARQIELQEAIVESVNNAALVDLWMSDPAAYRDEIYEAYKAANDYDKKPEALRDDIDKNFESLMLGLTTNQDKQEIIVDTIGSIQSTINQIAQSLLLLTTDITNAKSNGLTVDQAQTLLKASYSDLRNQGGYTVEDFAKSEIEYSQARQAFSAKELERNSYYAKDAQTEIASKNPPESANTNTNINNPPVDTSQQTQEDYNRLLDKFHRFDLNSEFQIGRLFQAGTAINKSFEQIGKDVGTKGINSDFFDIGWKHLHYSSYLEHLGFSPSDIEQFKKGVQAGYKLFLSKREEERLRKGFERYATGGLNTMTGPAWLDGTPSKPELVLNSTDTKNFLALKDILSKVMGSTQSINNSYGGDNIFEININVDKIEKDYDVDRVADRVKKKILESSSYRNVTQVRNFR